MIGFANPHRPQLILGLLWLVLASGVGFAQGSPTLNASEENRARGLGLELKCPVCQGSSIAESPSEFAKTMMAELRQQIKNGQNDQQILSFFVAKYGEDTRLKPNNPLVWSLPVLSLLIGAFGLFSYLQRASNAKPSEVSPAALEKVRQAMNEATPDQTTISQATAPQEQP